MTVDHVRRELLRLRQGQALARPSIVLHLSPELRAHLAPELKPSAGAAHEAVQIAVFLRRAIGSLGDHERRYSEVDFNLAPEHSFPTLTARQESLAGELRCASKTIRRHADRALESLALILAISNCGRHLSPPEGPIVADGSAAMISADTTSWREELQSFWRLLPHARVDIVCSEIPEEEQSAFASPLDRNYLRYAKFADLDSLIYVRTRLTQASPDVLIRDLAPSEYHGGDTGPLVVIGGPPWNAKYREFMPHLPFHFEPHALGEDDPLVIPMLDNLTMGPRWTPRGDLLEDLAVFTRLTLAQGTTIFLLGGCLTLGVLGAAKCFLEGAQGARNARYVADMVGDHDFVLVTEARRMGGITDATDLEATDPLLVLARRTDRFSVIVDNAVRYRGDPVESGTGAGRH
jgi:hypothetical protein